MGLDRVRGLALAYLQYTEIKTAAERLAYRQRRMVLRTDDWLDESLGFAGKE